MSDEPTIPQNDLDFLMSLDPLSYADADIDVIIAYQRRHRHQLEGGVKPARRKAQPKAGGEGPKLDLAALFGDKLKAPEAAPTKPGSRRF